MKQVWGWLYGVVVSPSETFRHLAKKKPVGVAVLLLLVLALVPSAIGSSNVVQMVMLHIESSHRWPIAAEMSGHFVGTVLAIVILYVVSARFRGSGDFAGLFSAVAFARLPALFSVPVDLLSRALGGAAPGGNPISTGVGIWTFILTVIALSESRGLQTGESIMVFIVSFLALMVVGGLVLATILM